MAEYDGSIRIGVKLDLDNAEKQLEHLKNRMQGQIKEINQQAQAVNKLKAEYDKLFGGMAEPKAIKAIADDIAKTKAEAILLEEELSHLSSMDAVDVSPETVQRMQELKDQIAAADERSDLLKQNLIDLSVSPEMIDKIGEMADRVQSADSALGQMRAATEQTKAEIGSTGQQVEKFNAYLRGIKDNATVADQGILDLQEELKTLEKRKQDLEAAGVGLGFQDYDETVSRIREIKGELNAYSSSLGQADTKSESWMSRLGKSAKRMGAATVSAAKKAGSAVGGLMKRITSLGRNKGFEKAGRSASHFASRLKEIVKGALFFNIISRALTGLTNQLGKYLSVNKNFSAALDGIKSNLLTAFQPIYEAAMPALTKLMEALESASAKMASFIAMIFGTTASQAQQNAKDLYEQANAEEAVGEAAEDAEKKQKKFLASFDTIEKLGEEESKTSQDKKTDEKDKLGFDTAFEEVKVPQWLTDFWKVLQDSWKQYGEATVQAFRFAMDGLKAAAVSLGQVFMSVWTDGTGLAFLNQIQLLLQQILLMIGNIGQTFAQVWSSGVGEMVLHELFNLLTTILGIMTSMAASFNAVWTGGAGEAVLTALLTLLATVLGIIGDIAEAFKAAWDSGAGEAALEAIAFAITAVLTMLNSVGQAFRDAWKDNGLGVQIWTDIINIIKGVFEIIGQLATRFTEAWEANENGKAIWETILQIIQNVTGFFDRIIRATAEWASGLDLEPIVSGFRDLMETLEPLVGAILDGLAWAWENVLLPLASWTIEDAVPAGINLLTGALKALNSILEVVSPLFEFLWNNILKPLASFVGGAFVAAINALAAALQGIADLIQGFVDSVANAVNAVQNFFSGAKSATSGGFGGSRSGGFSSHSYSAQSYAAPAAYSAEQPTAAARLLYSPELMSLSASPRMARAVETTPNTEYIAASASARNSGGGVTMSDIEQAVSNVMSRVGGGSTKVNVSFTGSLAQLVRLLQPEINVETQRLGPDLVGV